MGALQIQVDWSEEEERELREVLHAYPSKHIPIGVISNMEAAKRHTNLSIQNKLSRVRRFERTGNSGKRERVFWSIEEDAEVMSLIEKYRGKKIPISAYTSLSAYPGHSLSSIQSRISKLKGLRREAIGLAVDTICPPPLPVEPQPAEPQAENSRTPDPVWGDPIPDSKRPAAVLPLKDPFVEKKEEILGQISIAMDSYLEFTIAERINITCKKCLMPKESHRKEKESLVMENTSLILEVEEIRDRLSASRKANQSIIEELESVKKEIAELKNTDWQRLAEEVDKTNKELQEENNALLNRNARLKELQVSAARCHNGEIPNEQTLIDRAEARKGW